MAASVANAAPVNPNAIKTFLANGLSTFLNKGKTLNIKHKTFFSNGPESLPKNIPD